MRNSVMPRYKAVVTVVGCGAVGQFYAAQLIQAGHEVRLVARRDVSILAERGIIVHQTQNPGIASSIQFPVLSLAPSQFTVVADARDLTRHNPSDWVLVALKTTALDQARRIIEPLMGHTTGVVVMCNGLGIEDQFASWFGAQRVYGLLCFVGINRSNEGIIHHMAFGHVVAGHFLDNHYEQLRLMQLCESAGVACEVAQSLLEARWRKLAWNVPFNGLSLLYDCTTDAIVACPERRAFALRLAEEAVELGNLDLAARGQQVRIEPTWAEEQLRRTDTMGAYAPSTLLDARAGRPQEVDVIFGEPARRAQRLGAKAPALQRLLRELKSRGVILSPDPLTAFG